MQETITTFYDRIFFGSFDEDGTDMLELYGNLYQFHIMQDPVDNQPLCFKKSFYNQCLGFVLAKHGYRLCDLKPDDFYNESLSAIKSKIERLENGRN